MQNTQKTAGFLGRRAEAPNLIFLYKKRFCAPKIRLDFFLLAPKRRSRVTRLSGWGALKKVIFFVQQHPSLFSAKITAILKTNLRHQNVAIQVWMKVLGGGTLLGARSVLGRDIPFAGTVRRQIDRQYV